MTSVWQFYATVAGTEGSLEEAAVHQAEDSQKSSQVHAQEEEVHDAIHLVVVMAVVSVAP